MTARQPARLPDHPGLAIRVYTVNPLTGERTPMTQRVVLPAATQPMTTAAWPPCSCPLCGSRR